VRIREYTSADFDALRRMHAAQGFGYPLPDLESPLFLAKLVLEEEDAPETEERDCDAAPEKIATAQGREEAHRKSPPNISGATVPNNFATTSVPNNFATASGPNNVATAFAPSRVVMAVLLRLTAETYLLHDPAAGTPRRRWQRFLALHQAARDSAAARGLDDVQAFLPPRVARSFGRRLAGLGWTHDPWTCFSRRL
jgi:hypothetical protein